MGNRTSAYLSYRDELLKKYNHQCANCGSKDNIEIHHIVPVALGGINNITNLVPLCHACHQAAHHGRNVDEIKEQRGTANRGGRMPKISFEEFDVAFEKYINGEIGKMKLSEITGYEKNGLSCSHNIPNLKKRWTLGELRGSRITLISPERTAF